MPPGPRDYTRETIRRLDTLSGNLCAKPGCLRRLIAEDGQTIVSKICHIEAASVNGPRYNPEMTDDQRRNYNNLILLCDEHHRIIDNKDNEEIYTVELLRKWKLEHERIYINAQLNKNPSLLAMVINAIADIDFDDLDEKNTLSHSPNIESKILYNGIKRNKILIDEYKVYNAKISGLYAEMEEQGSFKESKLLRTINNIYLKVKGQYVADSSNQIDIIRKNADNIIDAIRDKLFELISVKTLNDDIIFGIDIVMVDAFMRCKILENPT